MSVLDRDDRPAVGRDPDQSERDELLRALGGEEPAWYRPTEEDAATLAGAMGLLVGLAFFVAMAWLLGGVA